MTFAGIFILLRLKQPLKALLPIFVTLPEMVISVIYTQPLKAYSIISPPVIVTFLRDDGTFLLLQSVR